MKHIFIAMVGNWVDRINIILEREEIDKNIVSSIRIVWDPVHYETRLDIDCRG